MTKRSTSSLILALVSITSLVVITSCKKSSSSPSTSGGTITATVDGTNVTFNNILIAKDTAFSGAYILSISGANALNASTPEISISVDGTAPIVAGTYTFDPNGTNEPGISFSEGSTLVYSSDITGTYPSSVVITSLTKTNVQGTFTGTLTLQLGSGAATKAITNGKFDVNFK